MPAPVDKVFSDKLHDVRAECDRFTIRPALGQERSNLTDQPALFWLVRGVYLIVYQSATSPLRILPVLPSAKNIGPQL
jgi:hypothetical protein